MLQCEGILKDAAVSVGSVLSPYESAYMNILESLNEKQREAVVKTDGPLLILAGAGSGKTKTLTHRVAYLISERGVRPGEILAVTFTNKAAGEMKERIGGLLGGSAGRALSALRAPFGAAPFVGTFHSLCVRILRRDIDKIGRDPAFQIFDTSEQKKVMTEVVKELGLDIQQFKPASFLAAVSGAKNELIDEASFMASAQGYFEEMTAKAYERYQQKLIEHNALDFDDILRYTVRLFSDIPPVLEGYRHTFRYMMVDEYQDTNKAQYKLIRQLADGHRNICVVGDDAQSIYRFRGADIRNILEFEKDYPDATVVFLEQNYRSTQTILDAADNIIANNVHRKEKKLWTDQGVGEKVVIYEAPDELGEAQFVSGEIKRLHNEESVSYSDISILYRTNAQSRALEERFLRDDIPYKIVGGIRFYDRKEIKDLVSYVRFWINPRDFLALERVVNEPKRGIGKQTLLKWQAFARERSMDAITAGLSEEFETSGLQKNKIAAIRDFCGMMRELRDVSLLENHPVSKTRHPSPTPSTRGLATSPRAGEDGKEGGQSFTGGESEGKLSKFLETLYRKTGYARALEKETGAEAKARQENIYELFGVAKRYDALPLAEAIQAFLEDVSLVSDTDDIDANAQAVQTMTLHSAKGLEFPYVFIVGMEEGILPHSRSTFNALELEEERRLMYVGVTRAKTKLYLVHANQRLLFGSTQANPASRFLDEIPEHLAERKGGGEFRQFFTETYGGRKVKRYNLTERGTRNTERKTGTKEDSFSDGEKVTHEAFGRGIIVSQNAELYTVVFQKAGIKKIAKGLGVLAPVQ